MRETIVGKDLFHALALLARPNALADDECPPCSPAIPQDLQQRGNHAEIGALQTRNSAAYMNAPQEIGIEDVKSCRPHVSWRCPPNAVATISGNVIPMRSVPALQFRFPQETRGRYESRFHLDQAAVQLLAAFDLVAAEAGVKQRRSRVQASQQQVGERRQWIRCFSQLPDA